MTRKSALLKPKEHWKELFTQEYIQLEKPIGDEYNRNRKEGRPSWVTVSKMFGIRRWSEWLDFCGLEPSRTTTPSKLKVIIRSNLLDEIERLWGKEKIHEFFPDLTCEVITQKQEKVKII